MTRFLMQQKSLNLLLALFMLIAIVFMWTKTTQAALEIVEEAFEVTPGQIEWPSYDDGRLVVTPCRACKAVALRVSIETGYFLGFSSPLLTRQVFIQNATSNSNFRNSTVTVFYRPEDRHVTRVVLDVELN